MNSMVNYVKEQILTTLSNNPQQAIAYIFDIFAKSPSGKMFFKNINCDIEFARKFVIEGGNFVISNWKNKPPYQMVSSEQLKQFTKNYREISKLNILPENEVSIVSLLRSGLNVVEIKDTLKLSSSIDEISKLAINGNNKVEEKLNELNIGYTSNDIEQSTPLKQEDIQNIIESIKKER